ncbi:sensor domain-containing diguanylate cyclase [Aliagarivorans taiwanensis]|uniref:sensor domain-containing diguanylate cyclase n=1 Tax=Aliagarivorans taiwanensis TaxID=561966 RepID=UPI0004025A4E|nr:GGDEF domain-containing protein [Aliagarivorans taiwanensis]
MNTQGCLTARTRFFCCLLLLICASVRAEPPSLVSELSSFSSAKHGLTTKPELIESGWSYHWGDIPRSGGNWAFEGEHWTAVADLGSLSQRGDETILWLRLELPASRWRDPYIFANSFDLTAQVYEQGQLSYQFGEFDAQGNSRFAGWPWHLIPVNQLEPTTLYFRVYSNYAWIGLSGPLLIGNKADLLAQVYHRGLWGQFFIGVVAIVGLLVTLLGLIKQERSGALSAGLLSTNLALMMFAENELAQEVVYAPLVWRYIAAFSYFLIPAFLSWVVVAWLKLNRSRLVRGIAQISLLFPAGVLFATLVFDYVFINAYPLFDGLFIVLVLGLLVASCRKALSWVQPLRAARAASAEPGLSWVKLPDGGAQQVLVVFGIVVLFVSLLLDMLSSHGFITWIGRTGQWGLSLFSLTLLGVYLLKDLRQQRRLRRLTASLEAEVEQRTKALRSSEQRLKQLAREDFLTKLLNRRAFMELATRQVSTSLRYHQPLSLLLFDIDHFKQVNDQYGHPTGDQVLKSIAQAIKLTCRQTDLLCRYGGEEFALLLQASKPEQAKVLSERLQEAICAISVTGPHGEEIKVTASFGLIYLTRYQCDEQSVSKLDAEQLLQELLAKADDLMYQVKSDGRNDMRFEVITSPSLSKTVQSS